MVKPVAAVVQVVPYSATAEPSAHSKHPDRAAVAAMLQNVGALADV